MRPLLLIFLLAVPQQLLGQALPDTTHLLPPAAVSSSSAPKLEPAGLREGPEGDAPAHAVPFGADENVIELAVMNTSASPVQGLRVVVGDAPAWVRLEPGEQVLEQVGARQEAVVSFSFSLERSAPVGEPFGLRFTAELPGGQAWTKEIRLVVEAPKEVRLHANYPNPFNPQTRIGYELPGAARVSLRIYNMLGQEVAVLAEAQQQAGYHEAVWEAGQFASGLYLYRLVLTDEEGRQAVKQKTMLLVK